MIKQELLNCLSQLQLSPGELARLLSVTPRTVHRWLENPEEVSGPAKRALDAWSNLKKYNLPWRPDCIEIPGLLNEAGLADQIAKYRDHSIFVHEIIRKVEERGGLSLPWQVDLDRGRAELKNVIEVMFHKLHGKHLSIHGYRRIKDELIDIEHNRYLIEEAVFAIHQKLAILNK